MHKTIGSIQTLYVRVGIVRNTVSISTSYIARMTYAHPSKHKVGLMLD